MLILLNDTVVKLWTWSVFHATLTEHFTVCSKLLQEGTCMHARTHDTI